MSILNLTCHDATPDQIAQGVAEPTDKFRIRSLLQFDSLPKEIDIDLRAESLVACACKEGAVACMIGGAPWLMSRLEKALKAAGIQPLYAFSKRSGTRDVPQPDGSVKKEVVFRHAGWVEV